MAPVSITSAKRAPSQWLSWARRTGDLLLPPLCLGCHAPTHASQGLCGTCWTGISFIAKPFCPICGVPFDYEIGENSACLDCLEHPPVFQAARAAVLYNDATRPLLLAFKHGDRTLADRLLARWLLQSGAGLLERADIIAPVPLHRKRLWWRRYNQAALLVERLAELAQAMGARVRPQPDLLLRTRATPQQQGNRKERLANVKNAFAVRPRHRDLIAGKSVLLVDDIMTTGATLNSCAEILLKAGAATVNVLTVARVAKPS